MAIGSIGWIGMAKETEPGTATATVNVFFATESFSAYQSHEPVEVNANVGSMAKLGYLKGKLTPQGKLSAPLSIDNADIFYWALGDSTTTDNGDGTYTSVIKPALNLPTFTVHADEVIEKVEQAGARINKLTLKAAAGEVVQVEMEWLAQVHTDGKVLTETVNMPSTFMNFTEAVITIDGTTQTLVDNIELSIENGLEAYHTLGTTRYPQVVDRKERPKFTGKIALIDWKPSLYQKMINAEHLSVQFELTDANGNEIKIELPQVQLLGGGFDAEIGTDRITVEPDFEAVGTDPITITVIAGREIK